LTNGSPSLERHRTHQLLREVIQAVGHSLEHHLQRQLHEARPADLVKRVEATAPAAAAEVVVEDLRGLAERGEVIIDYYCFRRY